MPDSISNTLAQLEAQCASLCLEYHWLTAAGAPNYELLRSDPSTFEHGANLMLLAIHPCAVTTPHSPASRGPHGPPAAHDALLDALWPPTEPGSHQLRELSQAVAAMFGDAGQVLRTAAVGNMIPFRTESISRLPDALRKHGLSVGARLVAITRPRVLVLLGGDRVLFRTAVSQLPGRTIDSTEIAFGATQRAYRDVLVAGDGFTTFAAVIPLHALQEGLRTLQRRLAEHDLLGG